MVNKSAGVVMVRIRLSQSTDNNCSKEPVFLCVEPGGPWKNMAWSIPKGGREPQDNTLFETGTREFEEETGQIAPVNELFSVGSIRQRKGKTVHAWYFIDNDNNPIKFRSNTYRIEHPKGSGRMKTYKEAITHQFLTVDEAKDKLIDAQFELILRIKRNLEIRNLL